MSWEIFKAYQVVMHTPWTRPDAMSAKIRQVTTEKIV